MSAAAVGGPGRSIYGADNPAAAAAAARSVAGRAAPTPTSSTASRQRRMYNIESPRRADMGSVPDVSQVPEVRHLVLHCIRIFIYQHRKIIRVDRDGAGVRG